MINPVYLAGVLVFAASAVFADTVPVPVATNQVSVIEKFRAPMQKHANGVVKTLLHAQKASLYPEGEITAERIILEMYDDKANFSALMQANDIFFNKERTTANSSGHVRYERAGLRIDGDGLIWNSSSNKVTIISNAVLRISSGGKSILEELN